jgi:hypothetical protein
MATTMNSTSLKIKMRLKAIMNYSQLLILLQMGLSKCVLEMSGWMKRANENSTKLQICSAFNDSCNRADGLKSEIRVL